MIVPVQCGEPGIRSHNRLQGVLTSCQKVVLIEVKNLNLPSVLRSFASITMAFVNLMVDD